MSKNNKTTVPSSEDKAHSEAVISVATILEEATDKMFRTAFDKGLGIEEASLIVIKQLAAMGLAISTTRERWEKEGRF